MLIRGRDQKFYQEEPARRSYCSADIPKDYDRPLIIPVVNHLFQKVRVRALRHGLKKVTRDRLAPLRKASGRNRSLSTFDGPGQVENYAVRAGVPAQNRREQHSVASPNVHYPAEASKIVRFDNGRRVETRYVGHAVVKNLRFFGMLG